MKLRQLENILFVVLMVFLLAFAGTREFYVGTDTPAYYRIFEMIASSGSWFKVHYYEPLYVFINQFVSFFGGEAKHLILLTAFITILPISLLFKRTSYNPTISLALYLCVFGFLMLFNGVRQAIAIAFFAWFIYFIFEKKIFKSLVFAVLSICFHYTAAIAVVVFLIFKKLNFLVVFFLYIVSLPFIFSPEFSLLFFTAVFDLLSYFIPKKYASYVSGIGVVGTIGLKDFINQILFIVAFYFYFLHKDFVHRLAKYTLLCTMLSTLLFNFFYYVKYLDRLAFYFFIFNAISIPLLVTYVKGANTRLLLKLGIVMFATLLLSRSLINGSNGITPYSSWLF